MSMILVPPTAAVGSNVVFLCFIVFFFCLILRFFLLYQVCVFSPIFLPFCSYDTGLVAWVDDEPASLVFVLSDASSPGMGHS